jgi:hypothetical protein
MLTIENFEKIKLEEITAGYWVASVGQNEMEYSLLMTNGMGSYIIVEIDRRDVGGYVEFNMYSKPDNFKLKYQIYHKGMFSTLDGMINTLKDFFNS